MDELTGFLMRARAGDGEAFEAFISHSSREIWRFAVHVLGASEADDATQEIFLAAWRALPGFRAEASARTWLFVIARRTTSHLARERRNAGDDNASFDTVPAPVSVELPPEYTAMLRELDEQRRIPFVLTQLFGFSYAEAATICDCPIGTIRSRIARAREDLIARWQDDVASSRGRMRRQPGNASPGYSRRSAEMKMPPASPTDARAN